MSLQEEYIPFSQLPPYRPPWRQAALSMVLEVGALVAVAWVGILRPVVFEPPHHNYNTIALVETPPPINHEPQPIRRIVVEQPKVVLREPPPDSLRMPALPKPKPQVQPEEKAPDIQVAEKVPIMQPVRPMIPRQLVRTNVFSTGSSEPATIAKAPEKVQTGGFGDPNGVPSRDNDRSHATNIARLGSFDLPNGPGSGNGTGGSKGVKGVVASAGFGNGVAIGDGTSRVSATRGTGVQKAGFGDVETAAPVAKPKAAPEAARMTAAEILFKPTPAYTEEARKLKIEGEVLVEVVFEASGRVRVLRVVNGLGHGLDESAIKAAQQIRFKPALREGQPSDSTAILHIIFQLA
jgi:TonB family protein